MKKDFVGKRAFIHTKELSESFGPRNSGSVGEHKAADYISKEFKIYGLKVNKESHEVTAYKEKKCVLKIDGIGEILAVPFLDSKATSINGIKADIYYSDQIDAHFLDKKKVKNKIIVTNQMRFRSFENLEKIIAMEPKAIIFTMYSPDREPINYYNHDNESFAQAKIPMALIKYNDSLILK